MNNPNCKGVNINFPLQIGLYGSQIKIQGLFPVFSLNKQETKIAKSWGAVNSKMNGAQGAAIDSSP